MIISVFFVAFLLLLDGLLFLEGCRASTDRQCVDYVVSFDPGAKSIPTAVYLDKEQVGDVLPATQGEQIQGHVSVCIDKPYARHIERGTVFYVSSGKMYIYNVWATGERLKSGDTLEGFSSKFKLYLYELKALGSSLLRIFRWGGA
mgnify:CR=1 FL=1